MLLAIVLFSTIVGEMLPVTNNTPLIGHFYFLDAIASLETGWLVGGWVMLFENSMKYTIIKDMITSIDQGPMNIVPELLPAAPLLPCTNQLT